MTEIRGNLRTPSQGFEANIELDMGIRSMFNLFAQARKK